MTEAGPGLGAMVGIALNLLAALTLASLAIWIWPRRARLGMAAGAVTVAMALTVAWSLSLAVEWQAAVPASTIAESLRNIAWLVVVYRLFQNDGRQSLLRPIRPLVGVLGLVEILHLAALYIMSKGAVHGAIGEAGAQFTVLLRLLVAIGALVLVHNLYGGARREGLPVLGWPAAGLAALWAFDLNLYTIAYLAGSWPSEIAMARGVSTLVLGACMAVAAAYNRDSLRLRPSRTVTFQTFSLLAIGAYLAAMVAVARWLLPGGGDFALLIELSFLTLATAAALVLVPSRRVRGWVRVTLAKHLFQHRYDYREEWLRFTRTIGGRGDGALPLGERAVQSLADLFESPGGLLLTPGEQGDLTLAARWNWPEIAVPGLAYPLPALGPFERTGFIADLDELRRHPGYLPEAGAVDGRVEVPRWLRGEPSAWALIPLVHYERLVGMVVLARPQMVRSFDWEDFDLLRVIGQQVASYLAENASHEALAEANRFEDFHRRIAFVMHDIKNLASQFSLLTRNAELHAEKPAFRADMLVTLRNSSDKLNAMLARLSRYGSGAVDRIEPVPARDVLLAVAARFDGAAQVMVTEAHTLCISAHRLSLEQVLVHLVQNAIDASPPGSPVLVSLVPDGVNARFDVVDKGCGMSAEFVRNRLFKPFVSTKSGGFGIGAFEARELVGAMRGRLEVESREGLGSRFIARVPLLQGEGPPTPHVHPDRETA